MEKEIKFKKFDAERSDFDCAQGEVRIPYNGRLNADGTFGAAAYNATEDTSTEPEYAVWEGEEYRLHGSTDARPIVEFAMHKEGILTSGTTITTTATGTEQTAEVLKAVAAQLKSAIDLQITGKGYFWQPFMVRYGVRLTDGTYLMLSARVLMLPTVLPPCVGLRVTTETAGTETKTHVTPDFSRIGRYTLQYRISGMPESADTSQIAAIDVYVSAPIETYVHESIASGYVTTYSDVVQSGPSYPIRGRNPGAQSEESEPIFEGHYSEGNGPYADHILDTAALNLTVAMVRPNVNLIEDITACSKYYRIASIPWVDVAGAEATEEFAPVPIHGDSLYELTTRPQMPSDGIRLSDIKVGGIAAVNGRLIIGTTGIRPPHPMPLAAMASYSGTPTPETLTHTIIRLYTRVGGRVYLTELEEESPMLLSAGMPRYLYQPDSRTLAITVTQGSTTYYFPFTPHPSGQGAQWCGGIGASVAVQTLDTEPYPQANASGIYECGRIMTTTPWSAGLIPYDDIVDLGYGSVTSINGATKAPTRGTFGKYTAYALTTQGVWMLEYDSAKDKIVSAQRINADSCQCRQSAVTEGENVYYISGNCIKRLSGSETEVISAPLTGKTMGVSGLPHIAEILRQCGLPEYVPEKVAVADSSLAYDGATATLLLTAAGLTYAYGIESEAWTMVGATDSEKMPTLLLVTRPVRLGEAIRCAEVLGRFSSERVGIAVYGANASGCAHLIGTAQSYRIDLHSRTPYRSHIFVITAALAQDEYLYGLRISAGGEK